MKGLRMTFDVLQTSLVDLVRNPVASLASVAAMGVAVFLVAAFLVAGQGVRGVVERWSDQASLEVFVAEGASDEAWRRAGEQLEADPRVERVERIDEERALEDFLAAFPDLREAEGLLRDNPLPRSLRVTLADDDPAIGAALAGELRTLPVVDGVRFDRAWIESLARLGRVVGSAIVGGAALLLLAALTTVGAVVRLALDDKREEVRLMRLVGAPASFVIAPVLVGGAVLAGLGAAVALVAAETARRFVVGSAADTVFRGSAELLLGQGLAASHAAALVVGAAGAGLIAAGLAAARAATR